MEQINFNYLRVKLTPSDINEHIETLKNYTKECNSVAELGVANVTSTYAFLQGLVEAKFEDKKLYCVDINKSPNVNIAFSFAKQCGIHTEFFQINSILVDIPNVDLLFIDTWHVYGHLKRELEKHHSKVNKYIIMHDTEIDGIRGETIRDGSFKRVKGIYPDEEILKGLSPAIEEFLEKNKEWKIKEVFTHNNGLTILEKNHII